MSHPSRSLNQKFAKYTLLIAEDNAGLQAALEEAALEHGFKVFTASDGMEASRKAQNQHFDVILVDMNLPKKLGHEVIADIRSGGPCQKSVIVVLSGYLKKEVVQAIAGKIEKAFTKPADIETVMTTLVSLLEQKQTKQTA